MPQDIQIVNIYSQNFQEPNTNQTKHQLNQEGTHKSDKQKNCPNNIKNPNQQMFEDKLEKIPKENKIKE